MKKLTLILLLVGMISSFAYASEDDLEKAIKASMTEKEKTEYDAKMAKFKMTKEEKEEAYIKNEIEYFKSEYKSEQKLNIAKEKARKEVDAELGIADEKKVTFSKFIDVMQGFLTPMIAIIAVCIAYQQHITNKQRNNRESKQAKLNAYKKIKGFLNQFEYAIKTNDERYEEFKEAIAEADFLFSCDVIKWLVAVESKAEDYNYFQELIRQENNRKDITLIEALSYDDATIKIPNGMTRERTQKTVNELGKYYGKLKDIFEKSMKS
jgi:hypothetical protein